MAGRCGSALPARSSQSATFMALSHVEPRKPDRIALAVEERDGLVERHPDDVRVGADELDRERAGETLDSIAAGLAAPLAGGEIALHLLPGQALEPQAGLDDALAQLVARGHEAHGRIDPVGAAG